MGFTALIIRAVGAVRNYFKRGMEEQLTADVLDVPLLIQRHLTNVYFSLLCASASSTLGSYLGSTGYIGSVFALFGAIMSSVCFCCVASWKPKRRLCLLISGAFFGWAYLAPWITWYLRNDIDFVVAPLLATSVGFGCFWAVFMWMKNIHFLHLISVVLSAVMAPFCCSWVAVKWTRNFELLYSRYLLHCSTTAPGCLKATSDVSDCILILWDTEVFLMVMIPMLYLVVYSQYVARRFSRADYDYVKHAICFYTDFPPIIIHLIELASQVL